jgi:hypothetical protein
MRNSARLVLDARRDRRGAGSLRVPSSPEYRPEGRPRPGRGDPRRARRIPSWMGSFASRDDAMVDARCYVQASWRQGSWVRSSKSKCFFRRPSRVPGPRRPSYGASGDASRAGPPDAIQAGRRIAASRLMVASELSRNDGLHEYSRVDARRDFRIPSDPSDFPETPGATFEKNRGQEPTTSRPSFVGPIDFAERGTQSHASRGQGLPNVAPRGSIVAAIDRVIAQSAVGRSGRPSQTGEFPPSEPPEARENRTGTGERSVDNGRHRFARFSTSPLLRRRGLPQTARVEAGGPVETGGRRLQSGSPRRLHDARRADWRGY